VGKQFELIKEMIPVGSPVATLYNPANVTFQALQVKEAESASRALGMKLKFFEARSTDDFDAVFAAIGREHFKALVILIDPLFIANFRTLAERSTKAGLLTMTGYRTFAEAGALMSYGPNYVQQYKLAARYVDKILKGAKPGDLPIELPTEFNIVVNLKTAGALGITIPQSVLARANEVIQ